MENQDQHERGCKSFGKWYSRSDQKCLECHQASECEKHSAYPHLLHLGFKSPELHVDDYLSTCKAEVYTPPYGRTYLFDDNPDINKIIKSKVQKASKRRQAKLKEEEKLLRASTPPKRPWFPYKYMIEGPRIEAMNERTGLSDFMAFLVSDVMDKEDSDRLGNELLKRGWSKSSLHRWFGDPDDEDTFRNPIRVLFQFPYGLAREKMGWKKQRCWLMLQALGRDFGLEQLERFSHHGGVVYSWGYWKMIPPRPKPQLPFRDDRNKRCRNEMTYVCRDCPEPCHWVRKFVEFTVTGVPKSR